MGISLQKSIFAALLASTGMAQVSPMFPGIPDVSIPITIESPIINHITQWPSEATPPSGMNMTTPRIKTAAIAVPTSGTRESIHLQIGPGVSFQDPGFVLLSMAFGVMSFGFLIL